MIDEAATRCSGPPPGHQYRPCLEGCFPVMPRHAACLLARLPACLRAPSLRLPARPQEEEEEDEEEPEWVAEEDLGFDPEEEDMEDYYEEGGSSGEDDEGEREGRGAGRALRRGFGGEGCRLGRWGGAGVHPAAWQLSRWGGAGVHPAAWQLGRWGGAGVTQLHGN